jgi:hypothetical protein
MRHERGLPGELVSIPEMTDAMLDLARAGAANSSDYYIDILRQCGCSVPNAVFSDLRVAGFFSSRPPELRISTRGHRTLLFASGALGASSDSVIRELRTVERHLTQYELVREGMTTRFIKGLLQEPGFQRLYFCSPWINLQKTDLARLAVALDNAARTLPRPPEMYVLVQTPTTPEMIAGLDRLRSLGAIVSEKPKLHSKLYMREPGPAGGLWLAIVGSENLTKQKWIELGIEIRNDSDLLSRLRSYFFEVFQTASGD